MDGAANVGVGVGDVGGSVGGGLVVGGSGVVDVEVGTCSEGHGRFRSDLYSPAWSMIRGRQPGPGLKGGGCLDHSQGGIVPAPCTGS